MEIDHTSLNDFVVNGHNISNMELDILITLIMLDTPFEEPNYGQ